MKTLNKEDRNMKNAKYIVLGIMMSLALSANARSFVKGEQIYVYTDQEFNWGADNAKLFLYLYNGGEKWIALSPIASGSKIYSGTFDANGNYGRAIIVRKNASGTAGNWNDRWNQTCSFEIPNYANLNYINKFWKKDDLNVDCEGGADWKTYSPAASAIATVAQLKAGGVTQEDVHVCPSAVGEPYSLKVKLNSTKTAYAYDEVSDHCWFTSLNGTTWTALNNYAGKVRSDEFDKDTLITLPASISGGIYYYLYSNIPAGRRLLYVKADGEGCQLDCTITSFETAISAVNADDNTYTLDGMVAFGKANGSLVIECDGKTETIDDPKSPQSFSLRGVPAATEDGKTTKAYAYFTGSAACKDSTLVNVPNSKEPIPTVPVDTLTGKSITLSPADTDPANDYVWIVNGVEYKKGDAGVSQAWTIPNTILVDSTVTVVYKEYYPATGNMDDMMDNGSYEDPTANYGTYGAVSTISDYNFWGVFTGSTPFNFYENKPVGVNPSNLKDNGFAVVRNSNHFAPSYAKVEAREGSNFALFDAVTGAAGGNKRAWYATSANGKLKLQKGTTYVLSFWAANINNYGEMDNAARFVFRIEYNGKTWESGELDLSKPEFRNNIWHQHSETFFADEDCDNVTISVVNLNTNTLNIGNDFALDDIQFHPISSVSKVVKTQQMFVVHTHEPKIDAFTATPQPMGCEGTSYTVKMHVEFQNPDGQLIIKDETNNTEYPYTVSAPYDTKTNLDQDIVINLPSADTIAWRAYFQNWPTAFRVDTTVAPVVPVIDTAAIAFAEPGCTDLTTTLTFDLKYRNQQGTLTYWVDGLAAQTATYSVADKNEQTLTALAFAGIPADGKNDHVLHVSFDGANSCIKTYALPEVPFSPVINSVVVSGVPATVLCAASEYPAQVVITTPYDATGRQIVLSGAKDTTVIATGKSTTVNLKLTDIAGAAETVIAAYTFAPTCTKESNSFTPPVRVSCNKWIDAICEGDSYVQHGFNIITPAVGTDTFTLPTNIYDTLILTVHATPAITIGTTDRICDDEANITLPFTVTNGDPDTFDIAIGTNHYTGSVVGTDIVFVRTAELVAGDYTATITAGKSGLDCSSQTTAHFTIALGGILLSKWTDVLFINNAGGRFVTYQWYKNDVEMSGETMQRLYDPNGLSGTADEYYCRMTTTDGKTLYTCPVTFDAVTPSRTLSTQKSSQVIGIYDTMGRPVTGTPARGVYVVVTEQDGEIITHKLFVHE
jgi:hypothetical protein